MVLFLSLSSSINGQGKVVTASQGSAIETKGSETNAKNSESNLLEAARASKASSEQLLKIQEDELRQATAKLEQLRQLVTEGLIARNELLREEDSLAFIQGKVNGTRQRIAESEQLIAGLLRQEEIKKHQSAQAPVVTKYRSLTTPTILRYNGVTKWSLANLSQVQAFFSSKFGRALPTSTIGQSTTHNRLGYDHRHAVDVAVHPDSPEGKALIGYLQGQGIPFLAFRGAVPGVSTGPHIHIGTPSHRLG